MNDTKSVKRKYSLDHNYVHTCTSVLMEALHGINSASARNIAYM